MEVKYSELIPGKGIEDFTPYQYEINKRCQYLVKYISMCNNTFTKFGVHKYPKKTLQFGLAENSIKVFDLTNCKNRDEIFEIYIQMIDYIVSEILLHNPFEESLN